MPQSRAAGLLAIYPHITSRDRRLLQLLDDHQVLTTDQIHRMLFSARRTCQIRLSELRALGLLDRFRFSRDGGGSQPWHWVLGHHGHRFQAAVHDRAEPTSRSSRQLVQRLSANPNLTHLLTANEFFVRLTTHARQHAATRLDRWWSETATTKQYRTVTADGHGLWSVDGTTVGFFLEADTGSEPLGRVVAKLDRYAALIRRGGPRYPVLFWLGSHQREEHLHQLLRSRRGEVPTATATHDTEPAAAVWLPAGSTRRVRLVDLSSDHGQPVADNPNYDDDGVFVL
ncbi:replication-relaxation family protein [Dactylosporangium aurantiacum]|uniref:Replication-relaxation family protein n=1 Tax=Dactylosporangium aurantiacum TaxID=35754 RepID=A0A9Q9IGT7_9ACTN|nr:replication-relaxation family protein [Dactylosporangium aurantiacum]MDG6108790.1 replication-relaxation family protein [Dactylosporangium aurantiacum]UWZ55802.1 replication-relaxation family protein [Dactylosporangium aurantiacum]